jgi:hypothetical protein
VSSSIPLLAVVAGLVLLALALALQPLTWSDPVPSASQLHDQHQKE